MQLIVVVDLTTATLSAATFIIGLDQWLHKFASAAKFGRKQPFLQLTFCTVSALIENFESLTPEIWTLTR